VGVVKLGQASRPAWLGSSARWWAIPAGAVAGLLLLTGCGEGGGSADAAASSSSSAAIPAPSVQKVEDDPGQALNVDTVCKPQTDGSTNLTVSFDMVNFGTKDVQVTGIDPTFPMGGLSLTGKILSGGLCSHPGKSNDLGYVYTNGHKLYTMKFKLPTTCPKALQIQAVVHLKMDGKQWTTTVPVLDSLNNIDFSTC
jgi:hypothetical protein